MFIKMKQFRSFNKQINEFKCKKQKTEEDIKINTTLSPTRRRNLNLTLQNGNGEA